MPPKDTPQDPQHEASKPEGEAEKPLSPEDKRKRDLEDFRRITDPSIKETFYGF